MFHAAYLMVDDSCNLICDYCYEKDRPHGRMSFETAKLAIDLLIVGSREEKKPLEITFFGGEPTLVPGRIIEILKYIKSQELPYGVTLGIITNGTLFNKKILEMYHTWHELFGDMRIQISIDGNKEAHDRHRLQRSGRGSFSLIQKNVSRYIEMLNGFGLPVERVLTAHSVLTPETLETLYDSYVVLRQELGFERVWYMPLHNAEWSVDHTAIYRRELLKISDFIQKECAGKNFSEDQIKSKLVSLSRCDGNRKEVPCGVGRKNITVAPNGDVYPCHLFMYANPEGMFMGNLHKTEPFYNDYTEIFKEYSFDNLIGDISCKSCDIQGACYTCVGMNYEHNGSILMGFPEYCAMQRVELEVADDLMKTLGLRGHSCQCGSNCGGDSDKGLTQGIEAIARALDVQNQGLREQNALFAERLHNIETRLAQILEFNILLAEAIGGLIANGETHQDHRHFDGTVQP